MEKEDESPRSTSETEDRHPHKDRGWAWIISAGKVYRDNYVLLSL